MFVKEEVSLVNKLATAYQTDIEVRKAKLLEETIGELRAVYGHPTVINLLFGKKLLRVFQAHTFNALSYYVIADEIIPLLDFSNSLKMLFVLTAWDSELEIARELVAISGGNLGNSQVILDEKHLKAIQRYK